MNRENLNKTIKSLKAHYYIAIAALVILFVLIFFKIISMNSELTSSVTQTMELYAIGITLIAIPAALKGFAYLIKKEKRQDSDAIIRNYKKAFFIRLYVISTVALMNEALYFLSRNTNFFWLTIVSIVTFIFCGPSLSELMDLQNSRDQRTSSNATE